MLLAAAAAIIVTSSRIAGGRSLIGRLRASARGVRSLMLSDLQGVGPIVES
jgi:hypothetical protein